MNLQVRLDNVEKQLIEIEKTKQQLLGARALLVVLLQEGDDNAPKRTEDTST